MSAASDPRRPAPPRSTLDWTLRLRELSSSSGPSRCWCRNQTNDEWSRFISIIPLRYAQRIRAWARTRDIRPACGCDGWRDRTAVRAGRCLAVSAGVQKPRLLHRIVGRAHRTRAPRTGRTGAPLRRRACTLPRSGRDARHRDDAGVLYAGRGSAREDTRRSDGPQEQVRGRDGSAPAAIARRGCAVPSDRVEQAADYSHAVAPDPRSGVDCSRITAFTRPRRWRRSVAIVVARSWGGVRFGAGLAT